MVYAKKLKTEISYSQEEEDVATRVCPFATTQGICRQLLLRL